MNTFSNVTSTVTSGISEITRSATKMTLGALNRATHPFHTARVMGRMVRRMVHKPGMAPGSLVMEGPKRIEKVRLRLFEYDGERIAEKELSSVSEAFRVRDNPPVGWVNVDGLHDSEIMKELRDHFGLHLLTMEDVVQVGQRSKMEEYDGYLFFILPMLSFHEETLTVQQEQLSLVLGPSWVLTFQERVGDFFEPVRERLRAAHGRIRHRGADYLAYALMDAVVDRYFSILERMGDVAEELDATVMDDPTPETLLAINHLKRELLVLRKCVWPIREALSSFIRTESTLVDEGTEAFVRDLHDNAVQIIDTVETLRDLTSGMTDLYLSSLGQKTNEVMKVLTIMASIFIPLTFMAGIYGMNFEYMPELGFPWAYPILWLAMLTVAGGMIWFFRKRGWL